MSLTETNIKIISLIVNVLLALVSVLMITNDIIILLHEPTDLTEKMANRNLNTMASLNIIPCVFNIIVTLYFSCNGITHQKSPRLFESVKWLSVLLSWTVFFAIFSYFYLSNTKELTKKILTHKCNEYNTSTEYRDEVDKLQYELQCCGVDDPEYWITQNFYNHAPSCYDNFMQRGDKSGPWPTGCVEKIGEINGRDIKRKSIEAFIFVTTLEIAVIGILLYLAVELKELERRTIKRQQIEMPLYKTDK